MKVQILGSWKGLVKKIDFTEENERNILLKAELIFGGFCLPHYANVSRKKHEPLLSRGMCPVLKLSVYIKKLFTVLIKK